MKCCAFYGKLLKKTIATNSGISIEIFSIIREFVALCWSGNCFYFSETTAVNSISTKYSGATSLLIS